MGLPDTYKLPGNYNDAYGLMGEVVVVPAVKHLADYVLEPLVGFRGLRSTPPPAQPENHRRNSNSAHSFIPPALGVTERRPIWARSLNADRSFRSPSRRRSSRRRHRRSQRYARAVAKSTQPESRKRRREARRRRWGSGGRLHHSTRSSAATGSVPVAPWAARGTPREQVLDWLTAAYPKAPFGADAKPLALGVGRLLWLEAKAAGIRRTAFNDAMNWLTKSPRLSRGARRGRRHAHRSRRRPGRTGEFARTRPTRSTGWPRSSAA